MKIWWCEEHQAPGDDLLLPDPEPCYGVRRWAPRSTEERPCRMVEMELVPINSTPAPYDIEIPDFVNRNSMGW